MPNLHEQESEFLRLLQQAPFDDSPAPAHRQDLRFSVLARFEQGAIPERARPVWQSALMKGRDIMRRPVSRLLVTTACLAIAAVWLFVPGGQTTAQAFNRFATAVASAKTAHFHMEVQIQGQAKQKFEAWYLAPGKYRQELGNLVNVSDFSAGKMVSIIPAEKKVVVMTIKGAPKDPASSNYFERVRGLLADTAKAKEAHYELLGEKQIDGRRAVGFRLDNPAETVTLWGDPATGLPVRIESVFSGIPRTEVAMSDFEINVDLKESLFDMTPPEGYKVQNFDVDASESREQDLIKAFESCAEISGGAFPDSLDTTGVMQLVMKSAIARATNKGEFSDEQFQELMKQSLTIGRGTSFALMLPASAEAHYAGKGAKRGDKDRVIFWYKPQDAKAYRVVYADLSVKDAPTAPKVEGAKRIEKASQSSKAAKE
ncbi:MAG: outer membrane lipoprotein carrier protein LolA [Planctomycetia bacterium]|nr:outer membrane lipoprotein carrier protein LolA [Planctomycetia bacterium]